MVASLPPEAEIVATDLNQPMLDFAAQQEDTRGIVWRQADAQHLPFDDASFDVVVCQFGVMFFPDRVAGYGEARRVLRPGGIVRSGEPDCGHPEVAWPGAPTRLPALQLYFVTDPRSTTMYSVNSGSELIGGC